MQVHPFPLSKCTMAIRSTWAFKSKQIVIESDLNQIFYSNLNCHDKIDFNGLYKRWFQAEMVDFNRNVKIDQKIDWIDPFSILSDHFLLKVDLILTLKLKKRSKIGQF